MSNRILNKAKGQTSGGSQLLLGFAEPETAAPFFYEKCNNRLGYCNKCNAERTRLFATTWVGETFNLDISDIQKKLDFFNKNFSCYNNPIWLPKFNEFGLYFELSA